MKFLAISDTHNQHEKLILPEADVIIHAGDVTGRGTPDEVFAFLKWFGQLDFQYRIFIAGNHDWFFEDLEDPNFEGVIYLNDTGVKIDNINIWGSPIQPKFDNWAFNRNRGEQINKHWQLIPVSTDLLITHGPPFGYLDMNAKMQRVGCVDLLKRIAEVKPKVHVFGHIHEDYGVKKNDQDTQFINASVLNENYINSNQPITFEL